MMPGVDYFALATDILGNHMGDYQTIKAVYVNVFASLYHGQLTRPVELRIYLSSKPQAPGSNEAVCCLSTEISNASAY